MKIENEEVDQISELILSTIEDTRSRQRRLISRILMASSVIARHSRIGPAHYVIIHPNHISNEYITDGHLAGMKLIPSDDENSVTVGRNPDEHTEDTFEIDIKLS